MANIDGLIIQAQNVIEELNEKLIKIEEIHNDIKSLKDSNKEIPEKFNKQYNEIYKLTQEYTNNIGKATNIYLDGNNKLFVQNLQALDSKNLIIQEKINSLGKEVNRIESVDLETNFRSLQKTLSDIFSAVNSINVTFGQTTQTLNNIVQSLSNLQTYVSDGDKMLKKEINDAREDISNNMVVINSKLMTISEDNKKLMKENGRMKVFQIISLVVVVALMVMMVLKI